MEIYVCRHGETEWSRSGQHTSVTDLPLTEEGEREAKRLKKVLAPISFDHIFTSPLKRTRTTCQLAGFEGEDWPDLVEWDYGEFEGLTTPEIHQKVPDWNVFDFGGGESVQQIGERADRVLEALAELEGKTLLFTSGHFSRVLAVRWVGLDVAAGKHILTSTASVGILTISRNDRVIGQWNCPS